MRTASGRRCEKLMLKGSVPERSTMPNGMMWTVPYSFIHRDVHDIRPSQHQVIAAASPPLWRDASSRISADRLALPCRSHRGAPISLAGRSTLDWPPSVSVEARRTP
jgi:hypothetical protein